MEATKKCLQNILWCILIYELLNLILMIWESIMYGREQSKFIEHSMETMNSYGLEEYPYKVLNKSYLCLSTLSVQSPSASSFPKAGRLQEDLGEHSLKWMVYVWGAYAMFYIIFTLSIPERVIRLVMSCDNRESRSNRYFSQILTNWINWSWFLYVRTNSLLNISYLQSILTVIQFENDGCLSSTDPDSYQIIYSLKNIGIASIYSCIIVSIVFIVGQLKIALKINEQWIFMGRARQKGILVIYIFYSYIFLLEQVVRLLYFIYFSVIFPHKMNQLQVLLLIFNLGMNFLSTTSQIVLGYFSLESRRALFETLWLDSMFQYIPQRIPPIEGGLSSFKYLEGGEMSALKQDKICIICLGEMIFEENISKIKECEHYFHQDCLKEWGTYKNSCPLCRHSIVPNEE